MKLYPIKCSCGSTRATKLTDKLANCVVCANPHDIQDVDYYTYEVTPLNDIMQQAKDQAVIDMWLDDVPYIDWSTCFDVQNISDEITEEEYMLWHIKRGTRHSAMKDIRRDFREDFLLRPFYELEISK